MIRTSVIIPVYNTAEYLRECIESVLAQTQKDIEIILVDDGSDDGSLEIEEEYAADYSFIRLLRQDREYQGTARNRGLEIAQGEFIYFMDSDDAILPELFDTCYRECHERELDFVMFDARGFRYDENDRELAVPDDIVDRRQMGIGRKLYTGPKFWNRYYNVHGVLYVCWLLYIRRSYLTEHDLYYEERTYFEDNDWMLRMYLHAERISYLPVILHRHRWRRGSNMLDGFTVGLMKGCFRMHDVLLAIYRQYRDAERLHMIEDVTVLNLRRFDRLKEIVPTADYTEPLNDFCTRLRTALTSDCSDEYVADVHLGAAIRILEAAKTWDDQSFYNTWRDLISVRSILRIPVTEKSGRIGIYGTGIVGKYYAELLQQYTPEEKERVFFIDTYKDGGSIGPFPIISAEALEAVRPETIVIASTKYRDEMIAEAEKRSPESRIICPPARIRFLV